jgi:hypothetical protein
MEFTGAPAEAAFPMPQWRHCAGRAPMRGRESSVGEHGSLLLGEHPL